MTYLGDFLEDETVYIPFTTNAADGGRESFSASLEEADVVIFKDGAAMTLGASTITITTDIGGRTGVHIVSIDMSNDADFTTGAEYAAVLYASDETLDSQAPAGVLATWSCENRSANVARWSGTDVSLSTNNKPDVNVDEWHDVALATTNPLPNAAADAAGGLPISDAGGLDLDSVLSGNTPQTGDAYARLGAPAGGSVSADVAAVKTDTGNLVTRITATLFAGITSLAEWLGLLAGKQAGDSTARTELRATGAGSGTFDETTDSVEAIRDRGDSAWGTATGFSTHSAADVRAEIDSNSTQLAAIVADTGELQANQGNWLTATGFSTHSAADVWSVATRVLTANTNLNDPTAAAIADAVCDEALSGHTTAGTTGKAWSDILADTNELQANQGDWATATGFSTHSASDVWAVATRVLTANTNLNDLSASEIRTAVGLSAANLDTQIAALPTQAEITGGAYALDTDANGRIRHVVGSAAGEWLTTSGLLDGIAGTKNTLDDLNDLSFSGIWTTQLTQSYAANGVIPTPAEAMFAIHQKLMQTAYSGTSANVYKFDNATLAFAGTLDDATNPTSDRRE